MLFPVLFQLKGKIHWKFEDILITLTCLAINYVRCTLCTFFLKSDTFFCGSHENRSLFHGDPLFYKFTYLLSFYATSLIALFLDHFNILFLNHSFLFLFEVRDFLECKINNWLCFWKSIINLMLLLIVSFWFLVLSLLMLICNLNPWRLFFIRAPFIIKKIGTLL